MCAGLCVALSCRDMGLMEEAEDLLSDICKFYSEDQWAELNTNAYSLLADCQMKLKMEDKSVGTGSSLELAPPRVSCRPLPVCPVVSPCVSCRSLPVCPVGPSLCVL